MTLSIAPLVWRTWLIRVAEWIIPPTVLFLQDLLEDESTETEAFWMHVQVVQTRATPAGTSEDTAVFGIDIVNLTSGAIDDTWTSGDFTNITTPLGVFLNALKAYNPTSSTYTQSRFYARRFNPLGSEFPFADSGPPAHIFTHGIAGTGTTPLPYQVSATITERTGWPGHWGRMYLPTLTTGILGTNGRLDPTFMSTISTAYATFITSLASNDFFTVVPVTRVNKQDARGLLSVKQTVMDDVPDVQRRRRGRQVASRVVKP